MKTNRISVRALLTGAFFAAFFAALTVYIENRHNIIITSTQIPVLPYLLLIAMVLLLNPLLRLVRVARAFAPAEIMVVFIMGMVSAGLSSFGLVSQLVPIAGNLFNSEWNNRQSEWNRYVVPYLNERYFVSVPGIQDAAESYRREIVTLVDKKNACDTARRLAEHARITAALQADLSAAGNNHARAEKIAAALANARALEKTAQEEWRALRQQNPSLPDWQETLRALPPEVAAGEKRVAEAERNLLALEEPAADKVRLFRRGLPRDQRAYPGILPVVGDDSRAYFARMRRMIKGMEALRHVKQVLQWASAMPADRTIAAQEAEPYSERLANAAQVISVLNDLPELKRRKEELRRQEEEFAATRIQHAERLREVSEQKRQASRARALELDGKTGDILDEMKDHEKRHKKFKERLEMIHREESCAIQGRELAEDIGTLRGKIASGSMRAGEIKAEIERLLPFFSVIDVSLRRYFAGQVPWMTWARPLARWLLLIGLTYVVLMSLNLLIFRQWAHNERLTYPLAELPKMLVGGGPDSAGLPAVFRNNLFWIGAAISLSVLGWNLFCTTQIVPGLVPLDLKNVWTDYVNNTQFAAWRNIRTEVFFTIIGLSFLVPKNISFSLWIFYLLYMAQLLILVQSGYGQDNRSFPWDWWYVTNFRSAQGQGALLIFSGLVLYKCRKYILCALFPASVSDLEASERIELKLSSLAFLVCSFGLVLLLWLSMGANLYYTIFFYIVVLVITIGLVRSVAEGGLLSFQAWASPFHYIRNFFGLNHSWTSASLFAPLMVFYAMLFLDIKTFIAPAMANALKLREDFRIQRLGFHVSVIVAIAVAVLTAIAAALMMSYDGGADTMYNWFYSSMPRRSMFEIIRSTIKDAPMADPANIAWTVGGGAFMAALLFFRQYLFWLPHPIGMIMLVNPIMDSYWFSIFLGWLCNVVVTKYGNKDTFHRAKGFFIGLIAGELFIVMLSFVVQLFLGTISGIDLNR